MDEQKNYSGFGKRAMIGLVLLSAGIILLLSNFGFIDYQITPIIFSWPMLLIVIGLLIYINSRDFSGIVLIFIGTLFGVSRFFDFNPWLLWPLILVFLGFHFLLNVKKKHNCSHRKLNDAGGDFKVYNTDFIDDAAVFGGGKKSFITNNFMGGKITAIFGGFEIDLTECQLAPGENSINLTAIFGGITLYIPKDWKIIVRVTPLFGGFSDSRKKDPTIIPSDQKILYLDGFVMFGGGEIKSW
ncbi:MAG: LiaF transmembrane domain-containing protein [Bacteroidota bacterium]